MNLTFTIDYRTLWGEALYIIGDIPELRGTNTPAGLRMELRDDQTWRLALELPDNRRDFTYRYEVRREDGSLVRAEWGEPRKFKKVSGAHSYELRDRWQDQPWDKPYYSAVFTDCVCRRTSRAAAPALRPGELLLQVAAPMIAPDEIVAICGNCPALGEWDTARAPLLSDHDFPDWSVALPLASLPADIEYKFVILKKADRQLVAWEGGDNRRMRVNPAEPGEVMTSTGLRLINPKAPWRGAGVAIPVFSLRSDSDFGVGDFYDLKLMIDWAALTGQKFIQVLPINDTTMSHTWADSYPYNANSCFALHPMYLRLDAVGKLKDPTREAHYKAQAQELNALEQVDYERVNALKDAYARELFAQEGEKTLASASYRRFVEDNKDWLVPYAAYCILRDSRGTAEFANWGEFAKYDAQAVDRLLKQHAAEADYVCWLQYHLDRQLRTVREYAHAHSVSLKGDIPIGISRNSVDAWVNPRLFNMNSQAGAPPDDFSVLGQNWGFPTYNWEEMGRDGFAWWKARFRKMAEYFDVYRIDHVLGFFRIWQIPMDALHGLLGVFNPALPFTPEELRHNYDFWLDVDLQTTPFIMDYFLGDFFGDHVQEAKERFLLDAGFGRYRLKPEFDTQRKVADYFGSQPLDPKDDHLCQALLGLIDQVLFIEDPYEKGKYHPRISAQYTYIYRSLTDYERWCFDRLYNDFYYHRHNDFWYGKAMWKLPPIIDATSMLTCAEDLGMIPACVPAVMNALEILTLDIQRMPKDPRQEFGIPSHYPYFSVCTTSTHDMGGIRAWWEEDREATQKFYNNVLHKEGQAPYFAEPWVCRDIVTQNLQAPSMLCILPLQDWLSTDGRLRRGNPASEQINIPAICPHYWRYRMHLTLEQLLEETDFNREIKDLVSASGR